MSEGPDGQHRLGTGVIPEAYRLRLEPDLDAASFEGAVEIEVTVAATTSEVVLNALELDVYEASVALEDGEVLAADPRIDPALQRLTLALPRALAPCKAVVRLAFRGALNDGLVGFYRSSFTDASGKEHVIAVTQLAPIDARRAFPCFDEPALKATFSITVVAPSGLDVYANTAAIREDTLADGRREIEFATTMRMSTYLVAVVVGPFTRGTTLDVDGVPLSVVATPDKAHLGTYALEVAAFALRFYADYFGMPYPGDKVDLVGIPDFVFGAMENLGCITFRENALLVDPSTASTTELQDVALTVAHELAHMWFGDLVTMAWWEGIWLNEAFATMLEYVCVDAFRPDWQVWVRFNTEREAGLAVDALHSTRAIEFAVHSPDEAMAMFDVITYRKGGTVLRMLEQYLGADVYRDGIRRYLRDHAYENTSTEDLWSALESTSGEPVGAVMRTWIYQGGHPVVRWSEGTLSQAPFSLGPAEGASAIGSSWQVPVRVRAQDGAVTARLLDTSAAALESPLPSVVNAGGSGCFRTSYGAPEFASIVEDFSSLSEVEHAVLLGDTLALARAGTASVADVLTLARGLRGAVEPSSWSIVDHLFDLLGRVALDAHRPALEQAARSLYAPVLDALGWDPSPGEDERTPLVRAAAIRGLGATARDADVRDEAARRFDAGSLDGEIAGAIIAVVAAANRPGARDELLGRLRGATDPQEAARYREGIAAIASAELAVDTFAHCHEWFRPHEAPRVIARLIANPVGGPDVWVAMSEQWDATVERTPTLMQSLLASGTAALIADRALAERVAAFHRAHPIESGQQTVEQSLETMRHGVTFAERVRPGLGAQLEH